jgi:acyl carrier protein
VVDRLARTRNGKVDKRAIADTLASAAVPTVAPSSATERRLLDLWSELLGRDDFGVLDRFVDLGGHSLLAMTVAARIESDFGVRVPPSRLFSAGTVADLARLVDELVAG